MKALVLIASALFAFTASAGEYSKSTVTFQAAATWVSAKNVCRDGNVLKHKTKETVEVEYCEESESGYKHDCKIVSRPLIQPVMSTAQRCKVFAPDSSGGYCVTWETYTLNQSSVAVWFYKSKKDMDEGSKGWTNGTRYTIPSCVNNEQ